MTEIDPKEGLEIEKAHNIARVILFKNKNQLEVAEILFKRTMKLIKDLLSEGLDPEQICLICEEVNKSFKRIGVKND